MPSEYTGQILNKQGYPLVGVNVSLIKLNDKLPQQGIDKPLTSGASFSNTLTREQFYQGKPAPNSYVTTQIDKIGYTIIKTVKSNDKGIWKIRTEETPDPLLTILKMDGSVKSTISESEYENIFYDEIIYNPQALKYGNAYPKYIPRSTLGELVKKRIIREFSMYLTTQCSKNTYDNRLSDIKKVWVILAPKEYIENGKYITNDLTLEAGVAGKTPQEVYNFKKSQLDQDLQIKCGGVFTNLPLIPMSERTEEYYNKYVIPEYKLASPEIIQISNDYLGLPLTFNLYTTTDPKIIQEVNQYYFDFFTERNTYEQQFAATRGRIDELVELNPMWEADELATWGPLTEISK